MAFSYDKLRGKIVEVYGSQLAFAKAFGVSENIVSQKMNNKTRFTSDDIIKIASMLDISKEEIGVYFFCEKSSTKLNK
ncbi:plasmid maintenance system antidote protein VapI [Lachnospiraceae bacterium PFB1-21]